MLRTGVPLATAISTPLWKRESPVNGSARQPNGELILAVPTGRTSWFGERWKLVVGVAGSFAAVVAPGYRRSTSVSASRSCRHWRRLVQMHIR